MPHFIPASCRGENCRCSKPAEHKVEEVIFDDDPVQMRHPLTAYMCHQCFKDLMGPAARRPIEPVANASASRSARCSYATAWAD